MILFSRLRTWWYQRYRAPFTVEREWSIFVGWVEPVEVFGLAAAWRECYRWVAVYRFGQAFIREGHGLKREWWEDSKSDS